MDTSTFAAAISLIFLSLRMWSSGKGWLSVIFHAVWNGSVVILNVLQGSVSFQSFFGYQTSRVNNTIISFVVAALSLLEMWRIARRPIQTK